MICFLLLAATVALGYPARAEVPHLINYQGSITGPSGPVTGNHDLTFRIYGDSLLIVSWWTEVHEDVPIDYGLFNVILGRYNDIPDSLLDNEELWIGITVDSDPEIAPRMRMTSVPWALRATVADTALVAAADGDWAIAGGDIYRLTGKVGIGTLTPAELLDVRDDAAAAYINVKGLDDGLSGYKMNNGSAYLLYDEAEAEVRLSNSVLGGNAGSVTIATRDTVRMRVTREGDVGIGMNNPQHTLDVDGTIQVTGFKMPTGASNGYVLVSDHDGEGTWQSASSVSDGDWNFLSSDIYTWSWVAIGSQPSATDRLKVITPGDNAVYAHNNNSNTEAYLATEDNGVYGYNDTDGNYGYVGGDTCGAYGISNTANRAGVYGAGAGPNSYGVRGHESAEGNYGILGSSGCGVLGRAYGSGDAGVRGYHGTDIGSLGNELRGVSGYSAAGYGVRGESATGYAGWFQGDLHVNGTLSKSHGTFLIDHPLDPENKLLRHMFVESPENLCIYRGRVELDARGEGVVEMPGYFIALTREDEATISLTSVGRPFLTGYEWRTGFASFTVYGEPGRTVSWVVYADRDDPVARRLTGPVEEEKSPDSKVCDRGILLDPEAHGYPASRGKDYRFSESRVK
jgi:hypothetical protein